jgi:hypothetical protein
MNDGRNLPSQRVSAPHQEELEEKGELPSSYKYHLINLKRQKQYIMILRLWQSFVPSFDLHLNHHTTNCINKMR